MPTGAGSFYLYLHQSARQTARTRVRDTVRVGVEFDRGYRGGPQHPIPAWSRASLGRNRRARTAWEPQPQGDPPLFLGA